MLQDDSLTACRCLCFGLRQIGLVSLGSSNHLSILVEEDLLVT